jgi:hypothetical protein
MAGANLIGQNSVLLTPRLLLPWLRYILHSTFRPDWSTKAPHHLNRDSEHFQSPYPARGLKQWTTTNARNANAKL